MASESELVEKGLPCEDCGSSDALALYSDGHTHCFSCSTTKGGQRGKSAVSKSKKDTRPYDVQIAELLEGSEHNALQKWGISQATARHCDYRTKVLSPEKGQHLAVYKDEHGKPIFVKVRSVTPEDSKAGFFGVGDQEAVSLYGIETLGKGGKMVLVTEGEKDRLAGSQLWANRFPVVGLPFGAESSGKAFARALPRLLAYDKIIFGLDMDKQGQDGTAELVRMVPPGKAFIARFTSKDLHQMVQDEGPEKTIAAIHNAPPHRPIGMVDADEIDGRLEEAPEWGFTLPYPQLYQWTLGLKPGQVWVGGAGVGMGKSDHGAEIVAHHIKPVEDGGNYQRVATFNYESDEVDMLRLILSKLWSRNFSVPAPEDGSSNVYWTPEELNAARAYRREKCAKVFINSHEGAITWDAIVEQIRYLHHAEDVHFFMIDPMAALVAQAEDKNQALDKLMAEAKELAAQLKIILFFWSHLTRPGQGKKPHEEGGRVELAQFRGSNSISMWADAIIGLERDTQADDLTERCTSTVRMLKIRKRGANNGKTFQLIYNDLTARQDEPVLALDSLDQGNHEGGPPDLSAEQEPPEL